MILSTICLILWVIFLAIAGIVYVNPEHPLFTYKFHYEKTLSMCTVLFFVFAALWIVFLFLEI